VPCASIRTARHATPKAPRNTYGRFSPACSTTAGSPSSRSEEQAEETAVLLRPDSGGGNRGLAVIVQDAQEVVLVNLIGNVRLDLFADYMAELDVDTPGIEIDPQTLAAHVQ